MKTETGATPNPAIPYIMGSHHWAIPEGYIPEDDPSKSRDMISHEAICILNAGAEPAEIEITVFFRDRDPVGPYRLTVDPRRTTHLRMNDLTDPAPIPRNTEYATTLTSSKPVIVQHTRLDGRSAENAIMTTIAYHRGA